jgi:hypothetical protein
LGAGDGSFAMQGDELVLGPLSRQQKRLDRRLPKNRSRIVESDESVVILYWRLIRGGAPDVEA